MKHIDKIQNLLPLGYLYLVILGILKESIVFYQLGINILKYSTIMDILISPIAVMTSHPLIFVVFILVAFYPFLVLKLFKNHSQKKWIRAIFGIKKNKDEMTEEEIENYGNNLFIKSFLLMYLSVFLGIALQDGYSISQKIKNNQLKYDYKMYYNSGDSQIISLIDSNSEYYFCISKGKKNINIIPTGSINNLEIINNKMLK